MAIFLVQLCHVCFFLHVHMQMCKRAVHDSSSPIPLMSACVLCIYLLSFRVKLMHLFLCSFFLMYLPVDVMAGKNSATLTLVWALIWIFDLNQRTFQGEHTHLYFASIFFFTLYLLCCILYAWFLYQLGKRARFCEFFFTLYFDCLVSVSIRQARPCCE